MEGRAATLRQEALQCLTIALAGSSAQGLRELVGTFFAAPSDFEHVWEYVDPKSKIARPLDLGETESEDEDTSEDPQPSTSQKSAKAPAKVPATKPPPVRAPKVVREDLCPDITKTIQIIPLSEETIHYTGIPAHLKAPRHSKTASSSGASLYLCPHPKCEPIFVALGGFAPLYTHIRRHHLGISLVCPYCKHKLYYTGDGWRNHMKDHHPEAPWYRAQVQDTDEEEEAARLVEQVEEDPLALSQQARRQETTLLESFEPDTRDEDTLEAEVAAAKAEFAQVGQADPPLLKEEPSDIEFPLEEEDVRHVPPAPTHTYSYAFKAPKAAALFPHGPAAIRYRRALDEDDQEEQPPPKKPKGTPE